MQMRYNNEGKYDYMYPETLGGNVLLNNGQTLDEWKNQIDDLYNEKEDKDFNVLWSGLEEMGGSTEITLPKKLSECKNGWILVFGDNYENGTNFSYHYVPKIHSTLFTYEQGCKFLVGARNGAMTSKYIFIDDLHVKGHNINSTEENKVSVLRRIISY